MLEPNLWGNPDNLEKRKFVVKLRENMENSSLILMFLLCYCQDQTCLVLAEESNWIWIFV